MSLLNIYDVTAEYWWCHCWLSAGWKASNRHVPRPDQHGEENHQRCWVQASRVALDLFNLWMKYFNLFYFIFFISIGRMNFCPGMPQSSAGSTCWLFPGRCFGPQMWPSQRSTSQKPVEINLKINKSVALTFLSAKEKVSPVLPLAAYLTPGVFRRTHWSSCTRAVWFLQLAVPPDLHLPAQPLHVPIRSATLQHHVLIYELCR